MRLDAVPWIMEDPSFADEEPIDETNRGEKVSCFTLKKTKTTHLSDTFSFLREIRSYVDKISAKANSFER